MTCVALVTGVRRRQGLRVPKCRVPPATKALIGLEMVLDVEDTPLR
jgi:hypothetical protein